jgi:hypothetical protein
MELEARIRQKLARRFVPNRSLLEESLRELVLLRQALEAYVQAQVGRSRA